MELYKFGILFIIGMGVFGGILGASLFQRLRIPQVVGYIVIGLILGQSGLHIIVNEDIITLKSFNLFALGIIGFLVGGELHIDSFKKYGKQFISILLGEGLLSFLLVAIVTGGFVFYVMQNIEAAIAAGVVFGAIASATDPASTVDVLWEYRSKGILTTSLIAIVALDDALAMTLYGAGSGIAEILLGNTGSMIHEIIGVSIELFGAVVVGIIAALALNFILRSRVIHEKKLPIAVGTILLVISTAALCKMDIILAAMTLGCVLTNLAPERSKEVFSLVRSFSTPIYVMFFVLVGARLNIISMPSWLWSIVIFYVVFRSVGKIVGAYLGARIANSNKVVRRFLGMGLFAQGGIAIGLSIIASQRLNSINVSETLSLGDMVVFVVTSTTLIVQLLGPAMVKVSISLSKEKGKDITEDDVAKSLSVADVVNRDIISIAENEPVNKVIKTFSTYEQRYYPVVDRRQTLAGMISLDSLKNLLTEHDCWNWLIAKDIMSPVTNTVPASMQLENAIRLMREIGSNQLPVVSDMGDAKPIGLLEEQIINKRISNELIKRVSNID